MKFLTCYPCACQGFAIGSAALVSLALFGAFVSRAGITTVDVLSPKVFIGLTVGAMLPYWFSAMTMKSVGSAALKMVEEVRRQFNTIPGLMEGRAKPDYATCVKISTDASLREMIPLVLLSCAHHLLPGMLEPQNFPSRLFKTLTISCLTMTIISIWWQIIRIISILGWPYIWVLTFYIQDFSYLYDTGTETVGTCQFQYSMVHSMGDAITLLEL